MTSIPGWGRSGADIVAEIEMVRTNFRGGFLVVEGDSDERFFRSRLPENSYIVIADGKRNVETAFSILDSDHSHSQNLVVGVVDEDYDWLTGHNVVSQNIVKMDPRDLEGLLLRSSALSSVLAEFANAGSVEIFRAATGESIRDALVSRAEIFGRIRMASALGPQVCLKKLKPQRFCDVSTWSYDINAIKSEAVRLGVAPDVASLDRLISTLSAPSPWHIVRGHDAIDVLVGGLKGVLGGNASVSDRDVERVLRQALQDSELRSSHFFGSLTAWQIARGFCFL